jgi:hypothetical protein
MVRDLQGTREAVDHKLAAASIRVFSSGAELAGDAGGADLASGSPGVGDISDEEADDVSDEETPDDEDAADEDDGDSSEEGGRILRWLSSFHPCQKLQNCLLVASA